ncbi:hypothetical protein BX666DRAFT_1853658, partial [Dichotomocladium elegans]
MISVPEPSFNAAAAAAAFVAATLAATRSPSDNNGSLTPSNVHLCVSDLLRSSQKAETLLEGLTTEQLNAIEETLNKIREKKTTGSSVGGGDETTTGHAAAQQHHEPVTEIRDGVEWVSFVYSHHRILRRYCIRTDLDKIDISQLDEKFKRDNCVYPRANLPRETYRGNRWAYETECNSLGWKLAYLNASEIAGKRGLIQRAVDSYRNRYPSMRSRRVARQEKMLNGTLRKRKHRDNSPEDQQQQRDGNQQQRYLPKTISLEDGPHGTKCRIRINIESVSLEAIDMPFRKSNCVFPRAINTTLSTPLATQRQLDEAKCNELGWKLAWLNPRQLANRKSLLQRVLDIYRTKFAPHIRPRKYASRMPPAPAATEPIKLTAETLASQQKQFATEDDALSRTSKRRRLSNDDKAEDETDRESIYSGTTASLDFRDCFSPPAE